MPPANLRLALNSIPTSLSLDCCGRGVPAVTSGSEVHLTKWLGSSAPSAGITNFTCDRASVAKEVLDEKRYMEYLLFDRCNGWHRAGTEQR
jgi:hypothetical protein